MVTPLDLIKQKRAAAIHRTIERGYLATRVYVGMATCEMAAGSEEVMDVFRKAIQEGELPDVFLSQKGCAGRCSLEPMVEIVAAGQIPVKYKSMTAAKAREIITRHLQHGEVIKEWTIQ